MIIVDVGWIRRKVEAYERMGRVGMILTTAEVRGLVDLIGELGARVAELEERGDEALKIAYEQAITIDELKELIDDAVQRGAFMSYCVGDDDGSGRGVGAAVGGADGGGDIGSTDAVAIGAVGGKPGVDGVVGQ
jgi:hypothetical protein